MAKADILIAEDDPALREIYMKKFTLAGYTIRTAENGEETLLEIRKKLPDLLILDISMPMVDGFAVLEKYPKKIRGFPVIILSNFGDEKKRKHAEEFEVDGYFIKSEMTLRKLLAMVETLLS